MADTWDRKNFDKELDKILSSKPPISVSRITNLKTMAMEHAEHHNYICQAITKFIEKAPIEYRLPGLYVIDAISASIVKLSRSKKEQVGDLENYLKRFSAIFKSHALAGCFADCNEKDKAKVIKTLDIWKQNRTYSKDLIDDLKTSFFGQENKDSSSSSPSTTPPHPPPAIDTASLLASLSSLNNASSGTLDLGSLLLGKNTGPTTTASITATGTSAGTSDDANAAATMNITSPPTQPVILPSTTNESSKAATESLFKFLGDLVSNSNNNLESNKLDTSANQLLPLSSIEATWPATHNRASYGQPSWQRPPPPAAPPPQMQQMQQMMQQVQQMEQQPFYHQAPFPPPAPIPPQPEKHTLQTSWPPAPRPPPPHILMRPPPPVSLSTGRAPRPLMSNYQTPSSNSSNNVNAALPPAPSMYPLFRPQFAQPTYPIPDPSLPAGSIRVLTRSLFVGPLPLDFEKEHVENLFSKYGELVSTVLSKKSVCKAFLKFSTHSATRAAKYNSVNLIVNDAEVSVNWAFGFGPKRLFNYEQGESIIPLSDLTNDEIESLTTTSLGGFRGFPVRDRMAIEEPAVDYKPEWQKDTHYQHRRQGNGSANHRHDQPRSDKRSLSDQDKPKKKKSRFDSDWSR